MFSPVSQAMRGINVYLEGVRWLRQHPKYLFLVFLPMVLSLILLGFSYGLFLRYDEALFEMILFSKPQSWMGLGFYYILKSLLYVVFFVLGIVFCFLLANIFAAPIYEYVSLSVESKLKGTPAPDISLWQSLLLVGEEIKKVVFIIGVSILLLFIPGLNVISLLVTAFLIGWDHFDYPLARRGWRFRKRLSFVLTSGWSVMGLGLWLLIPFAQLFLAPLAVVGGTFLCLEALATHEKKELNHAEN